jgi:hypothetical protein
MELLKPRLGLSAAFNEKFTFFSPVVSLQPGERNMKPDDVC